MWYLDNVEARRSSCLQDFLLILNSLETTASEQTPIVSEISWRLGLTLRISFRLTQVHVIMALPSLVCLLVLDSVLIFVPLIFSETLRPPSPHGPLVPAYIRRLQWVTLVCLLNRADLFMGWLRFWVTRLRGWPREIHCRAATSVNGLYGINLSGLVYTFCILLTMARFSRLLATMLFVFFTSSSFVSPTLAPKSQVHIADGGEQCTATINSVVWVTKLFSNDYNLLLAFNHPEISLLRIWRALPSSKCSRLYEWSAN